MLTIGSPFPPFSLNDQNNTPIGNTEVKGHAAIFIFYPGDMTPGCTLQLCAIRDEWEDFANQGIRVFGINHANQASHERFHERLHFPFPLLVDTDKHLSKTVGAIRRIFGIDIIKRTVIGIDGEGIVRMVKPGMPKVADILKAMKPFTKATSAPNSNS